MSKLLIIAPLYKGPELIPALIESLIAIKAELAELDAKVLLINDSPGYAPLSEELEIWAPRLAAAVRSEVLLNAENLGFIGACNRGFEIALREGADVLLLNSDCLMTPGTVRELHEVSTLDPMTAVVSPRSNNATICNSPYPERFRSLPFREALAAHQTIQPLLPRVTYAPTAVGFCLYIRNLMLKEFGVFDEIYGGGYNEENDFIFRCNRRGYRAVMANHAFAYHIGNVSFSRSDTLPSERELKNRAILLERYPEYERAVTRYFSGVDFIAQTLTAGLIPGDSGKLRLLFDCNNIGAFHNGTFELAFKMIQAFTTRYPNEFEYYIACNREAFLFHGFDRMEQLAPLEGTERQMAPFAVVVRLAQPFDLRHLVDIAELAPITCFLVLDTIALDCQNLDDQGLERVWRNMLETTTIVGYISEYSRDQFQRRFGAADDVIHFVALCSTDATDYAAAAPVAGPKSNSILLVGNHYPHKHVAETLEQLRFHPDRPPVVVLGVEVPEEAGVTSYRAGELEQSLVDRLYDEAAVVPSHYEGFGFPALHALARRKPLIARRQPVFEEIAARSAFAANIHLFDTTEEMVGCAVDPPPWRGEPASASTVQSWSSAAQDLRGAIETARTAFNFAALRRRLLHVEACRLLVQGETRWALEGQAGVRGGQALPPPPTAPRTDLEAKASEFVAKRTRLVVNTLSRSRMLRRTGSALWSGMRGERRIEVSLGDDLSAYAYEGMEAIDASALRPETPSAAVVEGLLEWAHRLVPGGALSLVIAGDPHDPTAMSALGQTGLRIWAVSAGFEVRSLKPVEGGLQLLAAKAVRWSSALQIVESDEAFVERAFRDAFGRDAAGFGADHCRNQLAAGVSRYEVLKHLYVSLERGIFVAGRYQL
jgi:GT2 family glycosyltransferase